LIVDVRGRGLLIVIRDRSNRYRFVTVLHRPGVHAGRESDWQWLALKLLERGVICHPARTLERSAYRTTAHLQPAEVEYAVAADRRCAQ